MKDFMLLVVEERCKKIRYFQTRRCWFSGQYPRSAGEVGVNKYRREYEKDDV